VVEDRSLSSRVLDVIVHTSMIFMLVVTLYPVLNVLASSLSSSAANDAGIVTIYPIGLTFDNYRMILEAGKVPKAFVNSVIYTVVGTTVNLLMTSSFAYALSRKHLALRKFYMTVAIIPMYFSGGLIPTFLLVKNLGLYNSMWALILPGAISITNFIIMRTFFQGLPAELEESAALDGANDFQILVKIILPLSKAVFFTIGLYYAVGHWNSWFSAMIYFKDSSKYPLQMILREMIIAANSMKDAASSDDFNTAADIVNLNVKGLKYATLFISMFPMLMVYPFIQKHFIKGVMMGSLKG